MVTIESPWRRTGALSSESWRTEFQAKGSPTLADDAACCAAAGPNGALALVQAWVEDQYATTGSKPQAKNPLNLRPGLDRRSPIVEIPGKGAFLTFDTYAACFIEWRRRLFDEAATYKGGVNAKAGPSIPEFATSAATVDVYRAMGPQGGSGGLKHHRFPGRGPCMRPSHHGR